MTNGPMTKPDGGCGLKVRMMRELGGGGGGGRRGGWMHEAG